MKCMRFDFWRMLTAYLQGNLSGVSAQRLEDHLTNCDSCRKRLSKLKHADTAAKQLPREQAPAHAWAAIQVSLHRAIVPDRPRIWMPRIQAIAGTAAGLIAALLVFAFWSGQELRASRFDREAYRQIPLSQISHTEEPHVSTIGYVSEVSVDEDEGDLTFKLVDNLQRPTHFVVCEIIPSFKMDTPPVGSRIRVYGVTRYDSKADHQWFEVHPVLNIEPVR